MTKNKLFFLGLIIILMIMVYHMASKTKISNTLTIGFCGDVMLGRLVNDIIGTKDYAYPWGNTLSLLHELDMRIINLETTLTNHTEKNPKVFNFRASPDRVYSLKEAHIDVVNLANNHILDFKEEGCIETLATLDKAGIYHVGAGLNNAQANAPVIITRNGITIGIFGCTDNEPTWKAQPNKIGTHYIEIGNTDDMTTIKKQISSLRSQVDIVIMSIHWGPNMKQQPSQLFKDFAHEMINAGVDIFHGHSAHVFQGIEIYNNKIIMYDTGDFIDDYAVDPLLRNDQSFLFVITVSKSGPKEVTLCPVIISNMQVNTAKEKEKMDIIQKMKQLSLDCNTRLEDNNFY